MIVSITSSIYPAPKTTVLNQSKADVNAARKDRRVKAQPQKVSKINLNWSP